MKQAFQNLRTGAIDLVDTPAPTVGRNQILIRTTRSLVSAGTERMLRDFAKAGMISKARKQPERVRMVLDKMRTDGVLTTIDAVRNKLDQPIPLGYCNVGRVIAVGANVTGFSVGDRVASNGPHAEIACVPWTLASRVPDNVDDDSAAFTVISSIALQGIRLLEPTLGETVAVFGLGLIGLVAVQILRANGCKVIGFDRVAERVEMARRYGAIARQVGDDDDPVAIAMAETAGHGVDGVLITASAQTDAIVRDSARMSRKRGRIVLTGVVGLSLDRTDFYEKELTFQVSCSYGPGRYDASYEQGGQDYPRGFVRWTEQRNFEAVLGLMADRGLVCSDLVSHRSTFSDFKEAYQHLDDSKAIGILLEYDSEAGDEVLAARTVIGNEPAPQATGKANIGIIGVGNFTQGMILPALKKAGANVAVLAGSQGASAAVSGARFGVAKRTTDTAAVFEDASVNAVIIGTRHDSHAGLVVKALAARKHVLVEKPLCLTAAELDEITAEREAAIAAGSAPILMVGFNRRFAPMTQKLAQALRGRSGPLFLDILCNAGAIPADHWVHDPVVGGGRVLGEACHFIDLFRYLAASPITKVQAAFAGVPSASNDVIAITLTTADGSVGQVNYVSTGSKQFPKERVTALWDGKAAEISNFTGLKGYGVSASQRAWRQDKGHNASFAAFVKAVETGSSSPIPFQEIINVTRATLAAVDSALSGQPVEIAA